MSKIAIHIGHPLVDGEQITFRAPCASADATGLRIYAPISTEDNTETSEVYSLKDAGGDTVDGETDLFTNGAYVTVALDTTNAIAYIYNAKAVYKADLQNSLNNRVSFTTDTLNNVYIYGSEDANQNVFQGIEFHTGANTNQRYRMQQDSNGYITLYRRKADDSGWDSVYKGNLPRSITNITRSGTTFTATRADGTTFTFDQQDNNTWNANNATTAGYVAAPTTSRPRYFYSTDNSGVPAWRQSITVVGASSSANGTAGLVPAPTSAYYANRAFMYLRSDGGWQYLPLANNTTTTAEHYALDARQGKVLNEKIAVRFEVFNNTSTGLKVGSTLKLPSIPYNMVNAVTICNVISTSRMFVMVGGAIGDCFRLSGTYMDASGANPVAVGMDIEFNSSTKKVTKITKSANWPSSASNVGQLILFILRSTSTT